MPGQESGRLWKRPRALTALCIVVLLLLLALDALGGSTVRLGGAMLAVPALAAVFGSPGSVLAVVAVMLPAYIGTLAENGRLNWSNAPVAIATAGGIGAAAVQASAVRARRVRDLARSREVTTRTQEILVRPLPPQLGPVDIASVYLASDRESTIGGDLYACALMDGRPRVMVADVEGKGLDAVEVVMFLINAFRQATWDGVPLAELPSHLDETLRRDLTRTSEERAQRTRRPLEPELRADETFATAVVVEVSHDGGKLLMVNCGHPAPLLLRDGLGSELEPSEPALPLGLHHLDTTRVPVDVHSFGSGDTLLLYTDGLIESRDQDGRFYPVLDRVGNWTPRRPDDLLAALRNDLMRHAGSRLADDVAMVAIRRSTPFDPR